MKKMILATLIFSAAGNIASATTVTENNEKFFRIETMFKMQECLESNLSDLTSNNDYRGMTQIKDYLDMTKNALSVQIDNSLNLDRNQHGMTNNDLTLLLMAYCAHGE